MRPTWLYRLYASVSWAIGPIIARFRQRRLMRDGVTATRAREILGVATQERPDGTLIWFHAASVGESLSVLPIIESLARALPGLNVLVTSGTPSSARLLDQRLPNYARHQFAPVDTAPALSRFLAHWRPNALVLVESELWPNMLVTCARANIPTALVGARLSARSLANWSKRAATFRFVLQDVRWILTQNEKVAEALAVLGIDRSRVHVGGNLKALAPPLTFDKADLQDLRAQIGTSPLWVAASTHPGEEEIVLAAHQRVRNRFPEARLILVPRHIERAKDIIQLIAATGLPFTQRSAAGVPTDAVYLADTLGEMGLWYALTPIVFLGGSLKPIGGHNPYEVAHAGAALLSGPHVANFSETYAQFEAADAVRYTDDAKALAEALCALLQDETALASAQANAQTVLGDREGRLQDITARLISVLELRHA